MNELLEERIILARDYRAFLHEAIGLLREKKPGFSLTVFARRAGLGSRGFILDVIRGKKRLTARSVPRAIKGLGLTGKLKNLFLALVERDEPDFNPSKRSSADLNARVDRLREGLKSAQLQKNGILPANPDSLYSSIDFLIVFSALGSLEKGATKEQILQRSRLPEKNVCSILAQMAHDNLLLHAGKSYKAINSHLVFEKLGRSESFQNVFLETLRRVRTEASASMESENKLFFHSVVPVEKNKLPLLKEALKSTMTEFIHEHQRDEGDHVAMLQLAFF